MTPREFYRTGEMLSDEPLRYTASGLDNIYLANGFAREVDEDGDSFISITDIDGLHRAIATHIVLHRKAPIGKELRFLRDELGLTQAELGALVGVSDQSIARWEKDRGEPSSAGIAAIRMLYLLKFYPDVKQNPDVPDIMEYLRTLAAQDEGEDGVVEFSYQDHEWQEQTPMAA